MQLHFIFPRWKKILDDCPELLETLSGQQVGSFRMAGLGIPTAAAAVPVCHDVSLTDEHMEPIDYQVQADLICIGYFTPQATNANAIADRFRSMGRTVVAGGIHPSMIPEDALEHFDAVMVGPAEGVWESLLEDFQRGRLKRLYRGDPQACFAPPRRDLFGSSGYLRAGIVQTARGCDKGCPFCVIPQYIGKNIAFKPVDEVIADIQRMSFACFYFSDENLLFNDAKNRAYRTELLERMKAERIRKIFFLAAYPFMVNSFSEDDIRLLAEAGCRQVYLVLGLAAPLCKETTDERLVQSMLRFRDAGIETMAAYTLGHEDDPPEGIEPSIARFTARAHVNLGEFTIWTPYPGTPDFNKLASEQRILTREWARYNGANVVFQPRHETPAHLYDRFIRMWREFYENIDTFGINQRYAKAFSSEIFDHE